MFIENVPVELYISDPSQLELGMRIWSVGQGGITSVNEPHDFGVITEVESSKTPNFFVHQHPRFNSGTEQSYRDHHIIPQTYNNWYICNDLDKANKLYEFLKTAWEANTGFRIYPK